MRTTTSLSDLTRILAISFLLVGLTGSSRAGELQTDGSFVSTKESGSPLAVFSTDLATGLNADSLDGLEGSSLTRAPATIITVGKSGADFTSLKAAVESITDASATKPYLIQIGPGRFNETEHTIVLPGHIHLRGSGPSSTELNWGHVHLSIEGPSRIEALKIAAFLEGPFAIDVSGLDTRAHLENFEIDSNFGAFRVRGFARAVITDSEILVRNAIASTFMQGVQVGDITEEPASLMIRDSSIAVRDHTDVAHYQGLVNHSGTVLANRLQITVSGEPTNSSTGLRTLGPAVSTIITNSRIEALAVDTPDPNIGIEAKGGTVDMSHSFVYAAHSTGRNLGIRNFGSESLIVRNSTIGFRDVPATGGDGGVINNSSAATLFGSTIFRDGTGSDDTVFTALGTTRVAHSQIEGAMAEGTDGTNICRYVTDESLGTFSTSCP